MTKREKIAAMILQGISANSIGLLHESDIPLAVKFADKLIDELERTEPKELDGEK